MFCIPSVEKPLNIQLNDVRDILNWVISHSSNQYGSIHYFNNDEKHIYFTFLDLPNYYDLKGLPLLIYAITEMEPKDSFIRFNISSNTKYDNQISFCSGFDENDTNLGYIQYFPIIRHKQLPDLFKPDI